MVSADSGPVLGSLYYRLFFGLSLDALCSISLVFLLWSTDATPSVPWQIYYGTSGDGTLQGYKLVLL